MAEGKVTLLLSLGLLNGKLQFTLDFSHEKIVNHDVICRVVKFVFDSYQFELTFHEITIIEKVHRFQDIDEGGLRTLQFGSHQIAHPKHY